MSDTSGPSMRAIMSRQAVWPPVVPPPGARRLPPPVRDAGAAGERHAAVDDEQLAVGAVVQAREPVPMHRLIPSRRGSRLR
jgi:hypothetical protein